MTASGSRFVDRHNGITFRPLHRRVLHWHVLPRGLKLNHELEAGVSILEMLGHFVTQKVRLAAIDIGAFASLQGLALYLTTFSAPSL